MHSNGLRAVVDVTASTAITGTAARPPSHTARFSHC
jgi:hypothetical protein